MSGVLRLAVAVHVVMAAGSATADPALAAAQSTLTEPSPDHPFDFFESWLGPITAPTRRVFDIGLERAASVQHHMNTRYGPADGNDAFQVWELDDPRSIAGDSTTVTIVLLATASGTELWLQDGVIEQSDVETVSRADLIERVQGTYPSEPAFSAPKSDTSPSPNDDVSGQL